MATRFIEAVFRFKDQFTSGAQRTAKEMKALQKQATTVSRSLGSTGRSLTRTGTTLTKTVTAPILGIGAAAGKAYIDFSSSMSKVGTIADTAKVPMSTLQKQILAVSDATGTTASAVAGATYDAISAGQKTGNAVNFVRSSIELAKAGFTSTGNALDVLTTITNNYGKSAGNAKHISDVLINTQNLGKVTVDELSASMGKVIPTASMYGVKLEDLASQYVALTKNGAKARDSTTWINSMLNEMGKKGTKSAEAIKKATGKTFDEFIKSGGNVGQALNAVQQQADKTKTKFSDMWSNTNARKGAAVLTQHANDYTDSLSKMTHSAGITSKALKTMAETPQAKLTKAINRIKNDLIRLGGDIVPKLLPAFEKAIGIVDRVAKKFESLPAPIRSVILNLAGVAAAVGPVMTVTGKLMTKLSAFAKASPETVDNVLKMKDSLKSLGASIATTASANFPGIASGFAGIKTSVAGFGTSMASWLATGPHLAIVAAGVAGVAVAAVLLVKNWSKVKPVIVNALKPVISVAKLAESALKSFVGWVSSGFTSVWGKCWNLIKQAYQSLKPDIQATINAIKPVFNGLGDIVKALEPVFKSLGTVVSVAFGGIRTVVKSVASFFGSAFVAVFRTSVAFVTARIRALLSVVRVVASGLSIAFRGIAAVIRAVIGTVSSVVRTLSPVFTAVFGAVRNAVMSVAPVFSNVFNAVRSVMTGLTPVFTAVFGAARTAVTAVAPVFSRVFSGIRSVVTAVFNAIGSAVTSAGPVFSKVFGAIRSTVGAVTPAFSKISVVFTAVINAVKSAFSSLKPEFTATANAFKPVINDIKSAISALTPAFRAVASGIRKAFSALAPVFRTLASVAGVVFSAMISAGRALMPAFTVIGSALKSVFSAIISAVRAMSPVLNVIGAVLKTVAKIVGAVFVVQFKVGMAVVTTAVRGVLLVIRGVAAGIHVAFTGIKVVLTVLKAAFMAEFNGIRVIVQGAAVVFRALATVARAVGSAIGKAFTAMANVIKSVASRIGVFMGAIKKVVQTIGKWIAGAFMVSWRAAWKTIGNVVNGLSNTFKTIVKTFKSIFGSLNKYVFGPFRSAWSSAWSTISDIFKNTFGKVGSVAKSIVNTVIDAVNGVIGAINHVSVNAPDWDILPDSIRGKHFGFNISTIPKLAKGTTNWQGGIAQVSERGGEIIDLPKGSRVYPHDQSVELARQEGRSSGDKNVTININVSGVELKDEKDIDQFTSDLVHKLQQAMDNYA